MSPDDELRTAARTISQMSNTDIQRKFRQIQQARNARSQHEMLRQQTEFGTPELDEAAYQAGLKAEEDGDLRMAARWYHAAAVNDFPEASLRLAVVLAALAAECRTEAESQLEKTMISDALEWYAKAFAAGEVEDDEDDELTDKLITRLDRTRSETQSTIADDAPAGASTIPTQLK